jgi:hypothetical protein
MTGLTPLRFCDVSNILDSFGFMAFGMSRTPIIFRIRTTHSEWYNVLHLPSFTDIDLSPTDMTDTVVGRE